MARRILEDEEHRNAPDPKKRPRGLTAYHDNDKKNKDQAPLPGKGLQRALAFGRRHVGTGMAFHKSPTRRSFDVSFAAYSDAAAGATPTRPRHSTGDSSEQQGRRRASQFPRLRERRVAVSHDKPLDVPRPHHQHAQTTRGLRRLSSQQRMQLAVERHKEKLREKGETVGSNPVRRRRAPRGRGAPSTRMHAGSSRSDPEVIRRKRERAREARAKMKAHRAKAERATATYIAAHRRRSAKHNLSELDFLPVLEEYDSDEYEQPRRRRRHVGRHSYVGANVAALKMKTNHAQNTNRPIWGGVHKEFIKL